MSLKNLACTLLLILFTVSTHSEESLSYTILEEKSHDPNTFTQGLVMEGEQMFESSGLYGRSFVRRYHESSNDIQAQYRLSPRQFAEGLTLVNQRLYLLTWRAQQLLVLDANTLQHLQVINYRGEGWGLTHNSRQFIMSDGSSTLYFRNLKTFAVERKITVRNKWRKYNKLNELEWAEDAIWANVWQAPYILKISPENGSVQASINLSILVRENTTITAETVTTDTVLNGIAYDRKRQAFWVTGKLWPKRYLLKFHRQHQKPRDVLSTP